MTAGKTQEIVGPSRCPNCGRRTQRSEHYVLCMNIGCPWFLTMADRFEHFRDECAHRLYQPEAQP